MKHPWITFSAICTLVMGIVLFCVVFGGYSSLLRSQNRVNTVKQMLADQCADQIRLARDLADTADKAGITEQVSELTRSAGVLKAVLIRMRATDPLGRELMMEFVTSQTEFSRRMDALITTLNSGHAASVTDIEAVTRQENEMKTAVIVMVKKYNKEARYFNNRTHIFPGAIIAKLFGLDHLVFPEIAMQTAASGETASAS